jgi:hypothetical protein
MVNREVAAFKAIKVDVVEYEEVNASEEEIHSKMRVTLLSMRIFFESLATLSGSLNFCRRFERRFHAQRLAKPINKRMRDMTGGR